MTGYRRYAIRHQRQQGFDTGDRTEAAKTWLNGVSPSMCLAKWFHVSLHLTNGRTHSCYHPPTHSIDREEIARNPKALHNTRQKKDERRQMLAGERPTGCSYCWTIEDAPSPPPTGHNSDRHYRSGEFWAAPYRDATTELPWNHDFDPTYVEVNFNQACNFRCSYCSPHLSTAWQAEIEKHGPYPTATPHNHLPALQSVGLMPEKTAARDNPYVKAFWEWWPSMYPNLRVFRMTGGEPLMDRNTFRVLDYVAENPKHDLEISVTSNMCPPDPALMDRFIKGVVRIQDYSDEIETVTSGGREIAVAPPPGGFVREDTLLRLGLPVAVIPESEAEGLPRTKRRVHKGIDHLSVYVSLDAWGERAEYIRNGMHFPTLLSNVKRVLTETHFTGITIINTFNCLSVTGLVDFLDGVADLRAYVATLPGSYGDRQRVWFDIPLLRTPAWQTIQVLPPGYEEMMEFAIDRMEERRLTRPSDTVGFHDFEIDKVRRNLLWMRQRPADLSRQRADFHRFFSEHDRRRGTSFLTAFPEMEDFWVLCKDEVSRG